MIEAITTWMGQAADFILSPEFQGLATAVIGLVTSIALIQNKVAALKVAKTENTMLSQVVEISALEKKIVGQEEQIKLLTNKIELQSAMFASAFLNSKKLDAATKQELAKLATGLQKTKIEPTIEKPLIDKVVEAAKQVAATPVVQAVEEATSIYKKLTKV